MEIQILDNTSEKYKDIKLYQAHGSVYGVIPAKRGFLKPIGQWNSQEVICKGKHITVKLNGEIIVDGNIEKASTPATIDGREHPDLERDRGYIVLCGHGSTVGFRNNLIKELK